MAHIIVNMIIFLFFYLLLSPVALLFQTILFHEAENPLHYTYACNAFPLFFNNTLFSGALSVLVLAAIESACLTVVGMGLL